MYSVVELQSISFFRLSWFICMSLTGEKTQRDTTCSIDSKGFFAFQCSICVQKPMVGCIALPSRVLRTRTSSLELLFDTTAAS